MPNALADHQYQQALAAIDDPEATVEEKVTSLDLVLWSPSPVSPWFGALFSVPSSLVTL